MPLGDYNTLDAIYNFVEEKTFENVVYGIANGGTASGIAYNKKVWADAGITEMPKTRPLLRQNLHRCCLLYWYLLHYRCCLLYWYLLHYRCRMPHCLLWNCCCL